MSFFNFNSYKSNNSTSSGSSGNMSSYINEKLQQINDKYFKNINIKKPLQFYYNNENDNININKNIDILHLYKTEQNKLNYYFLNNFTDDFLNKVFSISNINLIYDILNIYYMILDYNYKEIKKKHLAPIIDIYEYIYFIIKNNENTIKNTLNITNELLNLIKNINAKNNKSIGFYKKNDELNYIINKSYSYDYYILYYLIDSNTFENGTKIFNEQNNPINIEKLKNAMLKDLIRANYKIISNENETYYNSNLSKNNKVEKKINELNDKFINDLKNNISKYLKKNNEYSFNKTLIKILQSIYQVLPFKIMNYINEIYIWDYFIGRKKNPPINNTISYTITFEENNILINSKFNLESSVLDIDNEINIDFQKNTLNENIIFKWKDIPSKKEILFKYSIKNNKQIYNILNLNNMEINKNTIKYIRSKIINNT
jgi:hypothetical protein